MKRKLDQNTDGIEALGLAALAWLCEDDERLVSFLRLSGLEPATLRQAAHDPAFLEAVLDHVMSDERLLLDCARAIGVKPEAIVAAWQRTRPPDFDHES